jgi:hypothetical protein
VATEGHPAAAIIGVPQQTLSGWENEKQDTSNTEIGIACIPDCDMMTAAWHPGNHGRRCQLEVDRNSKFEIIKMCKRDDRQCITHCRSNVQPNSHAGVIMTATASEVNYTPDKIVEVLESMHFYPRVQQSYDYGAGMPAKELVFKNADQMPEDLKNIARNNQGKLIAYLEERQKRRQREEDTDDDAVQHFDYCPKYCLENYLDGDSRQEWLIDGILLEREPQVIGGPDKGLKSSIALDEAVALASGTAFLGRFPVNKKCRVLYVSAENKEGTFWRKTKAVCAAKGVDFDSLLDGFFAFFKPVNFASKKHRKAFASFVRTHEINVVVLDPAYLCFGRAASGGGTDAYKMGQLFQLMTRTCLDNDVTPIVPHHAVQSLKPGRLMELGDLLFSGPSKFFGSWILINRRSRYRYDAKHKLVVSFGGRENPGSMVAVDAYEGDVQPDGSGRVWEVAVSDYVPRRRKAAVHQHVEQQPARLDLSAPQQLLYDQVEELCAGGVEVPRTALDVLPKGGTRDRAIAALAEKGLIVIREETKEHRGRTIANHLVSLPPVPPS